MQPALHINKKAVEINWDKISENLLSILWQLVITTIVFYLISHFGKKILNHYLKSKRRPHSKRSRTITALINSIFQYTVIFFYLFGVLSILGIPIGTLLASAGIFSLAIGMGAQGFVSDLVNGFFILSEDQFDVGDVVQINQQIGTVIQLGLRTTRLKGTDGSIVPTGNITCTEFLRPVLRDFIKQKWKVFYLILHKRNLVKKHRDKSLAKTVQILIGPMDWVMKFKKVSVRPVKNLMNGIIILKAFGAIKFRRIYSLW